LDPEGDQILIGDTRGALAGGKNAATAVLG